jgi:phosphoserine phosphatase
VIAALQELGHEVYIISGGLAEPVIEFGVHLGVPRENIRAVEVFYDELSGAWWQNDVNYRRAKKYRDYGEGALTVSDGKAQIVRELLAGKRGRSLLVGDGISDLYAGQAVDLFVGFGGVVKRQRVMDEAACFIHSRSLAPLLAVATGPAMLTSLSAPLRSALLDKTDKLINSGAVTFQNERLSQKFRQAHQALYSRTN